MTALKNVITSLNKYERCGSEYYKIVDLKQCLHDISNLDIVNDIILTPFFLTPSSTYEIYDFELNIRNVSQSKKPNCFLSKTGKKTLKEIDQETLKKLELCYIEITQECNSKAIMQLKRYLEHLLSSAEIKERIPKDLGPFDHHNLYFEVYF